MPPKAEKFPALIIPLDGDDKRVHIPDVKGKWRVRMFEVRAHPLEVGLPFFRLGIEESDQHSVDFLDTDMPAKFLVPVDMVRHSRGSRLRRTPTPIILISILFLGGCFLAGVSARAGAVARVPGLVRGAATCCLRVYGSSIIWSCG